MRKLTRALKELEYYFSYAKFSEFLLTEENHKNIYGFYKTKSIILCW